jgi:NAD(P)-dependent dehydrogenase (short-subunit alcohol dehydrogenase family)
MDGDEFWRGFEVNVKETFVVAQAFAKNAAENAVFVSVNTAGAHMPYFGPVASYSASKSGSAKLVEYFQAENPHIRAYNISPGFIKTDMSAKGGVPDELFEDSE